MTVWHVSPHQLLQKSVLKGKRAQLMERATLMPRPKADGHATLSMRLCQRQQKDHGFGWHLGCGGCRQSVGLHI